MKEKKASQAVEDTITQIGITKTTDKKIADACILHGTDEHRVRTIAGLDAGGVLEYQIVRL